MQRGQIRTEHKDLMANPEVLVLELCFLCITSLLYYFLEPPHQCDCYQSLAFCKEEPDLYFRTHCGTHYECSDVWNSSQACSLTFVAYKYYSITFLVLLLVSIAKIVSLVFPSPKIIQGILQKFLFLALFYFSLYGQRTDERMSVGDNQQLSVGFYNLWIFIQFLVTLIELCFVF
jgi:hypothetical protein